MKMRNRKRKTRGKNPKKNQENKKFKSSEN
jgi:hypothetical protein